MKNYCVMILKSNNVLFFHKPHGPVIYVKFPQIKKSREIELTQTLFSLDLFKYRQRNSRCVSVSVIKIGTITTDFFNLIL